MRILSLALLALAAASASAQSPVRPYVALSAGASDAPGTNSCDQSNYTYLGFAGGATRRLFGVEGRLSVRAVQARAVCVYDTALGQDPAVYTDGVHTDTYEDFSSPDLELSPELRLRFGGVEGMPLLASVSIGRNLDEQITFGGVAVGLRTPGRVRLGADVEKSWSGIPYATVVREWRAGTVVREISRDRETRWMSSIGLRLVMELPLGGR
jgi:hypothetical protein